MMIYDESSYIYSEEFDKMILESSNPYFDGDFKLKDGKLYYYLIIDGKKKLGLKKLFLKKSEIMSHR